MLNTPFMEAKWLWLPQEQRDERDRRVRFRKVFELDRIPEKFEAVISADAKYNLYVNGQFVHHGPARSTHPVWSFDRIDLAAWLQPGKNLIAILGYQFGVSNYTYMYSGASGVIFNAPGVPSNGTWKISEDPGYIRAVAKGSAQYGFQEFFDCRKSDRQWLSQIDYDDSQWESTPGRVAGVMPWHEFEERNIPLLTNKMLPPAQVVSASGHEATSDWREVRSAIISYHRETPEYHEPQEVENPTCLVYDFGREVVGMLHFTFEADDAVDFLVCEKLDGLTPRITCPGELHTAYGGRLYPVPGEVNEHELTLPWGMRYVVVFNRSHGHFKCEVTLRECRYPLDIQGKFTSSDEKIQRIWDMCELTQQCCMADSYIDCPTREYAQWWGDALVQSQNTFRLSDDPALLRRGLVSMSRQLTPEGLTYGVTPGCAHMCILPDYSAMYLVTLLADYEQTASLAMWKKLRNTASGIISYFEKYITPENTIAFDERYWLFVDWCNTLNKVEPYNLIVLWGIRSAAKLAALSGEEADRAILDRCNALDAKLSKGVKKLLDDPSPHSAALAILLDIRPENHDLWLKNILLPLLAGNHDHPVQPDAYFMYYVFEALKKAGYGKEIIDCISRWWQEFIDAGCSTAPEHFFSEKVRYTSMCHAWSAHPLKFFSELLLGVRQNAPGWAEISFQPLCIPGAKFSGIVPLPQGNAAVEVDWSANPPVKKITLPDGVKLIG
ncbi:MAG: hypothetical protein E7053_03990 [Lentisphaerae bacterium]|nr:hypothetical protein [Lentisphaerota bacterium]